MNVFTLSSILVLVSNLSIAIFIFLKAHHKSLNIVFGLFCLSIVTWGLGGYILSTTSYKETAYLGWQIGNICSILTPILYFHIIFIYLNLNKKSLLFILYLLSSVFLLFNFFAKDLFLGELRFVFGEFYYISWSIKKNPIYLVFYISFYWLVLTYSFLLLLKYFLNSKGLDRNRMKYFIIASIMGWLGAHGDFLTVFKSNIYPHLNFLIAIHPVIIVYAILKHQLMDIEIVFKKGLLYSLLVSIITLIYLLFVLIGERFLQGLMGYRSFFISLFSASVIAILFIPLRNSIQYFLDRYFFKGTLESLALEREKLKQDLFQTEKLAYVGQLASSIVHEIKSPLTAIKTYIEYLPQKYNEPEFRERFQDLIPREIERINKVVNNLLDIAKPRNPELKKVDICRIIDSTILLLENNFQKKEIKIIKNYLTQDILIEGDHEQLKQVFLNLFINAIDAMTRGGTLTVSTIIKDPASSVKPVSNKSVLICVNDTGCGISEDNLKKLFTPFFTTKKEGVGLGLVISQEIISNHKGTIEAESEIDNGTKFILKFPALN